MDCGKTGHQDAQACVPGTPGVILVASLMTAAPETMKQAALSFGGGVLGPEL